MRRSDRRARTACALPWRRPRDRRVRRAAHREARWRDRAATAGAGIHRLGCAAGGRLWRDPAGETVGGFGASAGAPRHGRSLPWDFVSICPIYRIVCARACGQSACAFVALALFSFCSMMFPAENLVGSRIPCPRLPSPSSVETAPRSWMSCVACCPGWRASSARRVRSPSGSTRSTRTCRTAASRSARCTRSRRNSMATRPPLSVFSPPCSHVSRHQHHRGTRCCSSPRRARSPIMAVRTVTASSISASIRPG